MPTATPKCLLPEGYVKTAALIYGPFFPGNLAHRVVDLIHRSFLLPSCKVDLSRYHPRPCLQYYIKRCLGPCVEALTTPETYREAVRDAQLFLEGRQTELSDSLEERMQTAAASEMFELAARYRDLLVTLSQVQERQRMATTDSDDADVYGYHHENGMVAVNLFHMRGGKIVDRREFFWEELPEYPLELNAAEDPLPEAPAAGADFDASSFFSALLKQVYIDQQYVPRTVYIPADFADRATLGALLSERAKPQSGAGGATTRRKAVSC